MSFPYDFANFRAYIEGLIKYTFKNPVHLEEALHKGGLILINGKGVLEQNKTIAMVGDKALDLVLHMDTGEKDGTKGEADFREQSIATNKNLAKTGRQRNLEMHIHCNPGTQAASDRMVATAVEAIIGAVCVDSADMTASKAAIQAFGLMT